jgi:hypothetical protein
MENQQKDIRVILAKLKRKGWPFLLLSLAPIPIVIGASLFASAQLFCLLYWWMTGINISSQWFFVLIAGLVANLSFYLLGYTFYKLVGSTR